MEMPMTKSDFLKTLEEKLPDNLVLESISLDCFDIVSASYDANVAVLREGFHFQYSYVKHHDG
jgi:hypothetical protein